jgi:hypothetical protein
MPAIPGLQKCVSHFFGLLALKLPLVNDLSLANVGSWPSSTGHRTDAADR